jgi:hypothetical protein
MIFPLLPCSCEVSPSNRKTNGYCFYTCHANKQRRFTITLTCFTDKTYKGSWHKSCRFWFVFGSYPDLIPNRLPWNSSVLSGKLRDSGSHVKFKQGKVHPERGHEGSGVEQRYITTLSLTLALDEVGWLTPHPGCFNPGKETRYPLNTRLGSPLGRSGRVRKISPTPEFDPRTVQPVASRYTDCALRCTM